MVRTQIQLTEQQARHLRRVAAEEGVSVAAVVRRCVDLALEERRPGRAELYRRATALAGAFRDRDGATDLAAEHDRYLEDAFR
jgi:hypothetical protein